MLRVGDRVKFTNDGIIHDFSKYNGEIGEIEKVNVYGNKNLYHVDFGEDGRWTCHSTELKLVSRLVRMKL